MKRVVGLTAVVTLLLVTLGVLVSSAFPDGLERVAEKLGFASRSSTVGLQSPFANYETRYFRSRRAAQASAGLVGAALLYGFGVLLGKSVRRRRNASRNAR